LGQSLKKGLIVALVLGATLGIALSSAAQLGSGLDTNDWRLLVIVAPLTEEIFKGLSILIVAWFMWKTIPSSRYGAALEAVTGLGFAVLRRSFT
jgi:RsiW-degrading membrane proteinase PrsW (M82 family)